MVMQIIIVDTPFSLLEFEIRETSMFLPWPCKVMTLLNNDGKSEKFLEISGHSESLLGSTKLNLDMH